MKIGFNLVLGAEIPGFPKNDFEAPDGAAGIIKIPMSIHIFEENGTLRGRFTHPHWGESEAVDIIKTDSLLAFAAESGNDDKGGKPVYFDYVFSLSTETKNVVGFSAGRAPYFRSFLPVEGVITEN